MVHGKVNLRLRKANQTDSTLRLLVGLLQQHLAWETILAHVGCSQIRDTKKQYNSQLNLQCKIYSSIKW